MKYKNYQVDLEKDPYRISKNEKIVTEINNSVNEFNSMLDTVQKRIGNLENRAEKII